jgi:hypothetical protein
VNKIFTTLFITVISFAHGLNAQRIEVGYGTSFAGFGDLQGRLMSIGYNHSISNHISIYGQFVKSSMSGNKISYLFAGQPFLGLDYTSHPVLDINHFINNDDLINKKLLDIGSELHYAPPFSIINEAHFDLGTKISILRRGKFVYYIEGNLSLVNLEVSGTSSSRNVYINNESWVNDPEVFMGPRVLREVGLTTSFQDHFLDFGYGYGLGIDYALYDYLIIGANGHYNQYFNDAQNFVTWGIKIGLKI